ncbi:MAG: hypothetical protein MJE68_27415, partial [Proteobacteria bacterium]|nr:hypothetical protein [Pseudomonadota bacterium]
MLGEQCVARSERRRYLCIKINSKNVNLLPLLKFNFMILYMVVFKLLKFLQVKPLLELVPDAKYPLRLVEADLCKPETWPN